MNFEVFKKGKENKKSSLLKVLPLAVSILMSSGSLVSNDISAQEKDVKDKNPKEQVDKQEQEDLIKLCKEIMKNLPKKTFSEPTGWDGVNKKLFYTEKDSLGYTSEFGDYDVEVAENLYKKENKKGDLDANEKFSLDVTNGTAKTYIEKTPENEKVVGIILDRVNTFPGAEEVTFEKAEQLISNSGRTSIIFAGVKEKEKAEKTLWFKMMEFKEIKDVLEKALKEAILDKTEE